MIIQIKGTSGAGKTTAVKKFMESCASVTPVYKNGRRQPIAYKCNVEGSSKEVMVLGHYECSTGGCDNIKSLDEIFELAETYHGHGFHVLFEGLMISNDRKRIIKLNEEIPHEVKVLFLDTSLEECQRSIQKRRRTAWEAKCKKAEEQGNAEPILKAPDFSNTESKFKAMERTKHILKNAGVSVSNTTREHLPKYLIGKFY